MSSINFKDIELFDGKTFDKLLKDIYTKSQKKSKDFDEAIVSLTLLATKDASSAAQLFPLLVEYAEVSVKNDDTLVKLAGIIQRFVSAKNNTQTTDSGDWVFSQEERDQLLKQGKALSVEILEIESTKLPELKDK